MNLKSLRDNPMMTADGLRAAERVAIERGISLERALNYIGELECRIRQLEDRLDETAIEPPSRRVPGTAFAIEGND